MIILLITKAQLIGCPMWGNMCKEWEEEECGRHCFTKRGL